MTSFAERTLAEHCRVLGLDRYDGDARALERAYQAALATAPPDRVRAAYEALSDPHELLVRALIAEQAFVEIPAPEPVQARQGATALAILRGVASRIASDSLLDEPKAR